MVQLDRNLTNKINWLFDNILPPIIRDSKWFMSIWFMLLFGNKRYYFMQFKDIAPFLSKTEFHRYYNLLADKHINRKTDLNVQSIQKIMETVVGESVLDVGCGRGYLAYQIVDQLGKTVSAIDMRIPDTLISSHNPKFKEGDVEDLPFSDNSFDTVLCTHTLEHTQHLETALVELRRVARRKLIVIVPQQREYKYTFDLHIHFFPYISSLKKVMQREDATYSVIGNDLFYCEEITKS
jgi:ubiquinone/menaquinone biosynthesis C-methylase UbiE